VASTADCCKKFYIVAGDVHFFFIHVFSSLSFCARLL
jgi:hypothetical protein